MTEQAQLNLFNKMQDNIKEMSKTEELNMLMDYLRARLPKFMKFIQEEGGKKGFCNYNTFVNAIERFQSDNNLYADGVTRFDTIDKLKSESKEHKLKVSEIVGNDEIFEDNEYITA